MPVPVSSRGVPTAVRPASSLLVSKRSGNATGTVESRRTIAGRTSGGRPEQLSQGVHVAAVPGQTVERPADDGFNDLAAQLVDVLLV
jgi:hypothetical protein